MQVGIARVARQSGFQKMPRGVELSLGTQQVGQIDQSFDPLRLQRQNLSEEFRRRFGQAQGTGGVAQGEQRSDVIWLSRQRLFEPGNRFQMPSLGRQFQAPVVSGLSGEHLRSVAPGPLSPR